MNSVTSHVHSLIIVVLSFLLILTNAESGRRVGSAFSTQDHPRATLPSSSAQNLRRGIPGNFSLTVLCIGDSITTGVGDGYPLFKGLNNGYRLDLYNLLAKAGIAAKFIGTQISGTDNPQPRNEGYPSQPINSILAQIQQNGVMSQQPNLVLLHAGTNDNDWPQLPGNTDPTLLFADEHIRLGNLIDFILNQDPNAVVLVAKLIQNKYNQTQTDIFNAEIPRVVDRRFMQGYKIRTVDLSMIGGDELSDLLHPTATGYQDMAERWYSAIQDTPESWWTACQPAKVSAGETITTCKRSAISFKAAVGGNVVGTGFQVTGDTLGRAFPSQNQSSKVGAIRLNDMTGDGQADYVYIADTSGGIAVWLNQGQAPGSNAWLWNSTNNGSEISSGFPNATLEGIYLADLNGDGRDDYLFVHPVTGAIRADLNYGPSSTSVWNWDRVDNEFATGLVANDSAGIRLADFDGDGRADYIYLSKLGSPTIWLNQGSGNNFSVWTMIQGGVAPILAAGASRDDVQFADIDGDGMADYCWLDPATGDLHVWYNTFDGKNAAWTDGGIILSGKGYPGADIRLARIGSSGRADYVAFDEQSGGFKVWLNECSDILMNVTRALPAPSCDQPTIQPQTTTKPVLGNKPTASPTAAVTAGQIAAQGSGAQQLTVSAAFSAPAAFCIMLIIMFNL